MNGGLMAKTLDQVAEVWRKELDLQGEGLELRVDHKLGAFIICGRAAGDELGYAALHPLGKDGDLEVQKLNIKGLQDVLHQHWCGQTDRFALGLDASGEG